MPRGPLSVVAMLMAALGNCTLEHRPDVARDEDGGSGSSRGAAVATTADSVRAVADAFHEALALGDGARVAALTTPGAELVDQEEGVRWLRTTDVDAPLPAPLSGGRSGLGWTVTGSDFEPLGERAGLLVTRYRARVEGEAVPWTAVESLVLLRTADGWRIRYLHRSRGSMGGGTR